MRCADCGVHMGSTFLGTYQPGFFPGDGTVICSYCLDKRTKGRCGHEIRRELDMHSLMDPGPS